MEPTFQLMAAATLLVPFVFWLLFRFCKNSDVLSPDGKAVFVTGCDSGIGFETALLLDRLGFHVFAGCLYLDGKGAQLLKNSSSDRMTMIDLDITDREKIEKAKRQIQSICRSNGVTFWCLVNNAGICVGGELEWLTIDQCEKQVNVNLIGNIYMTKAFLPLLRQSRGRIINVTSVNGRWAYPGLSVYCATKHALEGLSASLRMELSRVGVRVVVVSPGDFARLTNILEDQKIHAHAQWKALSPELRSVDGDYFWSVHKSTCRHAGLLSPPSFEASPLMDDIREAVIARRPRTRYTSATRGYRLFLTLLGVLATDWSDGIILWARQRLLHSVKKLQYAMKTDFKSTMTE